MNTLWKICVMSYLISQRTCISTNGVTPSAATYLVTNIGLFSQIFIGNIEINTTTCWPGSIWWRIGNTHNCFSCIMIFRIFQIIVSFLWQLQLFLWNIDGNLLATPHFGNSSTRWIGSINLPICMRLCIFTTVPVRLYVDLCSTVCTSSIPSLISHPVTTPAFYTGTKLKVMFGHDLHDSSWLILPCWLQRPW